MKQPERKRICLLCGKEYQYTNGNQKYCVECRDKAMRLRKSKNALLRKKKKMPTQKVWGKGLCIVCGKTFLKTGQMHKICPECKEKKNEENWMKTRYR